MSTAVRRLVLVLGDQLDADAQVLQDFDPLCDRIWMAEVQAESTHVVSSKQRTTLFLSAMRHFAQHLRERAWPVHYTCLDDPDNLGSLAGELDRAIRELQPQQLAVTAPGEWRVLQDLRRVAQAHERVLEVHDDNHFLSTVRDFAAHAASRKQLRQEYFYRAMRQQTGVLMAQGKPMGGQWNFDASNRGSFGREGPKALPPPTRFEPDETTLAVMRLVQQRFASHPGFVETFGWPVTRAQALQALAAFIQHRLPLYGQYQDAMWEGEVWLYHSHLSCALNLKLLKAAEVVEAAEQAYAQGLAPIEAVEGFVRQILGWREYVRGIYWTQMPAYAQRNEMNASWPLPGFYWTAQTDMPCLRDAITQTLTHGYAHHIQRLMVTGLYALLFGVRPAEVHAWYLGMYVDAVEWVELPNTLGMSQFADGGLMSSKPYIASGKYIDRMSNHCKGCRFKPSEATGDNACPFTTLYWDYLNRHADTLARNPRMLMQLKNLHRLSEQDRAAIGQQAQRHRLAVLGEAAPKGE